MYYNYTLIYRKIKEINTANNSRLYLIKKNAPLFIVVFLLIIIISNDRVKKSQAQEMPSQIHHTTLAKNIKSDFSESEPEELIIETISDLEGMCLPDPTYLNQNLALKNKTRIDIDEPEEQFIISEERDSLSSQTINLNPDDRSKHRSETIEYVVQAGDTISAIASNFNLSVNTILWENNLGANTLIKPGVKLSILPADGIIHTVKSNENINKLASLYNVEAERIIDDNDLENNLSLKIGQKVFIPGGKKIIPVSTVTSRSYSGTNVTPSLPSAPQTTYTGGKLLWPTVGTRITQYYSWQHQGLDIANKTGTPLYAAEGGTVERSGWNNGYGYNVVINHGGGMKTLYAHASRLHVSAGDRVKRGDVIADMGSTGWSTGPHIHFEVIINGAKQNPLNYLR